MIDPIQSLAFAIQANRGVYALLLGSGISRRAKIPTGWEITLDLVRKIALMYDEVCEPDPESWYRGRFGKEPDYSELLDEVAKTPSERQQLLRGYWEQNEQEREEGLKQPTEAHRAIAALAADGFIRVIVTTNFDRLLERALSDAGVVPTVLSSPDDVKGAIPLIHTECCLFKVHGDYLDTRIRNTSSELECYPPEFDALLDRIFDEFGLVVCGWSGEWDAAMRSAIMRASSRRFSTYWALYEKEGDRARRVIDHRKAQMIPIASADSFFSTVQQCVKSIDEFSRPHPLSTEAAVASLKRYVSEQRYRIQLSDLVYATVDQIIEKTSGEVYSVTGSAEITTESATARVRGYEAACSTLLAMAPIGGYWAEQDHLRVWQTALTRLSPVGGGGVTFWLGLKRYPGTLLLYALGLGAVAAGRLSFLAELFATPIHSEYHEDRMAVELLPPFCMFESQDGQILRGMERRHVPLNDWIHGLLHDSLNRLIPNDQQYTHAFDRLEILISLSAARYHEDRYPGEFAYFVPGAFAYRTDSTKRILQDYMKSIAAERNQAPIVSSRIVGNTAEECTQRLRALEEWISELRWGRR